MGCCDFSINNPQNSCLVTWLLTWNITFWVKYSIKNQVSDFLLFISLRVLHCAQGGKDEKCPSIIMRFPFFHPKTIGLKSQLLKTWKIEEDLAGEKRIFFDICPAHVALKTQFFLEILSSKNVRPLQKKWILYSISSWICGQKYFKQLYCTKLIAFPAK